MVVMTQIWDIETGDVRYVGVVQCLFFGEQVQAIV